MELRVTATARDGAGVARGDDGDDQSADERTRVDVVDVVYVCFERTRCEKRSSSQSKSSSRARKSINSFFVIFFFFCGKKKDEEHDEKSNHGLDGFKRR